MKLLTLFKLSKNVYDTINLLLKISSSNTLYYNYILLREVGDFSYQNWSLTLTLKDVQGIKKILINPDLCSYIDNENYLRFLCNEQATKQNILDNLNWLQQQAKNDPEATILVYYSGHGALDESTGKYYLIPQDTDPIDFDGSVLVFDVNSAVQAETFNNSLCQIPAKKLLVIS